MASLGTSNRVRSGYQSSIAYIKGTVIKGDSPLYTGIVSSEASC